MADRADRRHGARRGWAMTYRRQIIVAVALWLTLAFVVWNVVFDRLIVLAGRRYSHDAAVVYRKTGHYLLINDVMLPAISQSSRVATAVAAGITLVGMALIWSAARLGNPRLGSTRHSRHQQVSGDDGSQGSA